MRAECDRLLRLNQEAMRRKADAASRIARRWFFVTLGAGARPDGGRGGRRAQPVERDRRPGSAADRGDDADGGRRSRYRRAGSVGDEIGTLAAGFNRMAERIRELRRSDLGKLLVAQQTTEAAIDSLYDPVIVTDSDGRVTRINPAAERLFGARADTLGKPIERSRATRASRRR